jgi:hypothetical protein
MDSREGIALECNRRRGIDVDLKGKRVFHEKRIEGEMAGEVAVADMGFEIDRRP